MGRSARVLGLLRPYTLLFAVNIVATVLSSLMDGATFVLLIPFPRVFFQRTKGGQLLARIISDTDQVKTAVTAALASFLRNVSLILVYLAILVGLSWRLTIVALVLAPVLVLIIRPIVARVRRRSREQA